MTESTEGCTYCGYCDSDEHATTDCRWWNREILNDVIIEDGDLRIDTYHAGEHSGFVHANHTAVRITHLPTGVFVESKEERSLHRNKQRCMELLHAAIKAHATDHPAGHLLGTDAQALNAGSAVPDGWVMVPKTLPCEMHSAFWNAIPHGPTSGIRVQEAWAAMLAAAPTAKKEG